MQYDLGLTGLGLLILLALGFGVIAQLIGRSGTHWLWLIASAAFFIGGLVSSEAVFAGQDVQPIIDGLSFDEVLLGGLLAGVPVAFVTWYATRRHHRHGPMAA